MHGAAEHSETDLKLAEQETSSVLVLTIFPHAGQCSAGYSGKETSMVLTIAGLRLLQCLLASLPLCSVIESPN